MTAKRIITRSFLLLIGLFLLLVGYFLLIRKLDANAVNDPHFGAVAYQPPRPVLLPTLFVDGARFYFKMATANSDTLLGFGDSGGGLCMAMPDVIARLHLEEKAKNALLKGVMPIGYIAFGDVVKDARFPSPSLLPHLVLRRFFQRVETPFFLLPKEDAELRAIRSVMMLDLFLGQNFFMGKAWTIDYPRQQIWVGTPLLPNPHTQPVFFRKTKDGKPIYGHPRITMEVEGEVIEVLFDTGASLILSEDGKRALGTTEKTLAGSFIAASVFDSWRKAHPEWRVFPHADQANDVIEVPRVKLGAYAVGPVLFARRPDAAWSEGMTGTMDRAVRGAIGGSALRYLRVVIDYNAGLIQFEQ